MKKRIFSIIALVALTGPLVPAADFDTLAGTDETHGSGTNDYCWVAIPPQGGGVSVVTFLSATSDKAGSKVQLYTIGDGNVITAASSGLTNYFANASTNIGTGNIVVVYDVSAGVAYKGTVIAGSSLTQTVLETEVTTAPGDLIYKCTAGGAIPVGNATVTYAGTAIAASDASKPQLLVVDGTVACALNAVTYEFVDQTK